ncbi:armadillo repeat-containing protein 10 isoform X1 [Ascaphus truei]|uniref:armadillo repeat-containing protein 10 isoform X1 n=1 Tax=Ascaphus truei TaxID=8439 RepID=UPI003F5A9E7E
MGTSGGIAVMKSLLGLVFGAGVCYCVYRLIFVMERKKQQKGKRGEKGSSLLQNMSGISVLFKVQGRRGPAGLKNVPKSASNLEPHHLENLIELLGTSTDSSVREQVLVTLSNSAAFSVNQDIIRNLNGISIIGEALSDSNPEIKVKALNALNNLSMNVKNQEQIKEYISDICKDINSSPLNSQLQLAGLRLLINMSVTNNYQDMVANSIQFFLHLLVEGNEITQSHVLKVLLNLSANPSMAKCLLHSEAPPALTSLFDSRINRDLLVRALTFSANLHENVGSDEQGCDENSEYEENSLHSRLFGDSVQHQNNFAALLQHPDVDVKMQVARLMINPRRPKQEHM